MPAKKIFRTSNLKSYLKENMAGYGYEVLSKAADLYHFFYTLPVSYRIELLKDMRIQAPEAFQFVAKVPGDEESTWDIKIAYIHLLTELIIKVRPQKTNEYKSSHIDDVIFIIYVTYFTGMMHDSFHALKSADFHAIENKAPFASDLFCKHFEKVKRYAFNLDQKKAASQNERKFKQSIADARRDYRKKFKSEKVEKVLKVAIQYAQSGDISLMNSIYK